MAGDYKPFVLPRRPFVLLPEGSLPEELKMSPTLEVTECPAGLTVFQVLRRRDESGVSGTGIVLEGVVFGDSTTVVRWTTETADHSTTVFSPEPPTTGWRKFLNIHILSHPTNGTQIKFWSRWGEHYEWNQPEIEENKLDPNDFEDGAIIALKSFLDFEARRRGVKENGNPSREAPKDRGY